MLAVAYKKGKTIKHKRISRVYLFCSCSNRSVARVHYQLVFSITVI